MARGAAGQSGDPWPWPRPRSLSMQLFLVFLLTPDIQLASAEFSKAAYMGRLCSLFSSNAGAPSGALIHK